MKNKKVYSTPEGLKYAASCDFSNASLAWIANLIWQYLLKVINVSGTTSVILSAVGFVLLLYGAIKTISAFESEIQAEAIANENENKLPSMLKKLTVACIIIRFILILISLFTSTVLASMKNTQEYITIDSFINIIGNVFTTINIMGIYSYKIFVDDGDDKKIRIYSLTALISFIARFLFGELNYIIKFNGSTSAFFSVTAIIFAVISYFTLFLMFEARKALYKTNEK